MMTAALAAGTAMSVVAEEPQTGETAETSVDVIGGEDGATEIIVTDGADAQEVIVTDDSVIEVEGTEEDIGSTETPEEGAAETEMADAEITLEEVEEVPVEETVEIPAQEPLEIKHVTVHDPSIVRTNDGVYYVVGSHTAIAKSADLAAWEQVNFDYGDTKNAPIYGNLQENFAEPFEWAGYDDGDCTGGYAIWAPDAIWNPQYVWEDGSEGAYMLYCCTSSTWRRSCICYLVAKDFEGPYTYVDTIVYSGFTQNGAPDGNSSRDTKWDNDYLNLNELIEKGSENGGIDEVSENWFAANGDWDNTYAPNAIDPNLFFDAAGEHLYMSYGSWSGGLFILELDPATGEAIYPGVDSVDEASGNFVDRYFGVHIAGGNHQSGEGPYIQYDAETGYYYLYETYGGLTAEGGYNMRLFRSENPYGPYLDAKGGNAADNGENNDNYGIKLIGNYSFYNQIGKRAAGHNSMLIDEDGSRYLVYHQRFDIQPQLEGHEVRVHQQFLNEDLWPTTAVYEYCGEQPANYADDEVVGSYEFICHGNTTTGEMEPTQMLTLYADGTTDGAKVGTWTKADSGKGYDYVTFEFNDGMVYKGYFFRQHKENTEENAVMTFSAIGNDNKSIWGSMINMEDTAMVADMAAVALGQMIPTSTKESFELPTEVMGAQVTWASSDPTVIRETGEVTPQQEDVRVELTAQVTCGETTVEKSCKVAVRGLSVLICGYDFEEGSVNGTSIAPVEDSTLEENAKLIGEATVVQDEERGSVLSVTNEAGAKGVNYLLLPEDTLQPIGPSGYSVAMWVKIGEETFEHSALFEADANADYPLTRIGANLIARINANNYSDVQGSLLSTSGERGVWEHVAYTVDPNGIKVYLNGELVGEEKKDISDCFRKNKTGISQAKDVMVGSGHIWDDEDCRNALFDDVCVYDGVLTASEVQGLCMQ